MPFVPCLEHFRQWNQVFVKKTGCWGLTKIPTDERPGSAIRKINVHLTSAGYIAREILVV
jgi:hypothetical protein